MKYLYMGEDDNHHLRAYKDTDKTEFASIDEVYTFIGESPFAFIVLDEGVIFYPIYLMPKDTGNNVIPNRIAMIYIPSQQGAVPVYLYGDAPAG